jgi:hypothetical protein
MIDPCYWTALTGSFIKLTQRLEMVGSAHCIHVPFTFTIQTRDRFSVPNVDGRQVVGRPNTSVHSTKPSVLSSIFQPPAAHPGFAAGQGATRETRGSGGTSTAVVPFGIKRTASLPLTYWALATLVVMAMAINARGRTSVFMSRS